MHIYKKLNGRYGSPVGRKAAENLVFMMFQEVSGQNATECKLKNCVKKTIRG